MPGSELVLTINYDLSLLGVRCLGAGDVAAVGARVCHIDAGDGQDANSLCGARQSFTVGLRVRLARRKEA